MRGMCIILTFHFWVCVYVCWNLHSACFSMLCYCCLPVSVIAFFMQFISGAKKTQNLQSSSSLEASTFTTWVKKERKKISADWNFSRVFGGATCFNDECLDKLLLGDLSFAAGSSALKAATAHHNHDMWPYPDETTLVFILGSDIYRHIWKCNLILIIVTQAHNLRWIRQHRKKTQVASCQAFKSNYTRFEPLFWNCPIEDRFACGCGATSYVVLADTRCRDHFGSGNAWKDRKIVIIRTHKWFVV